VYNLTPFLGPVKFFFARPGTSFIYKTQIVVDLFPQIDVPIHRETQNMNEHMAILLAREGNEDAFHRLYEDNCERVYRLAYRYARSPQDAEDIMQETFTKAFRRIDSFSFRGDSSFSAWLSSICINCSIDHLRKRKRHKMDAAVALQDLGFSLAAGGKSPDELTEMNETCRLILEAAGQLAPKQRIIFDLKYVQHHTIKEISRLMNCNENTVKTHLSRSVRKLKKLLDPIWRKQ
jgi:RNA polymerase sigma-70 factor (ECF subfamily)